MFKSELNLYCQQNNLELPIYKTEWIGRSYHEPIFSSSIVMKEKMFCGQGKSKKLAENEVAKQVLEYLDNQVSLILERKVFDLETVNCTIYTNIIMIDGDNLDLDLKVFDKNFLFLIFVAKNNTRIKTFDKIENNNSNVYIIMSESIDRDASDFYLTFYLGRIYEPYKNFYIVTKDHFGQVLKSIGPNVKHECNFDFMKSLAITSLLEIFKKHPITFESLTEDDY